MANLTIRNLTITPLELKLIERFEGEPVPVPSGLGNITSVITNFISGNETGQASGPGSYGVAIREGAEPHDRQEVSGVTLGPFETRVTDFRAADPGKEVLRLTFEEAGGAGGGRYTVDVPGPSPRSLVLSKVDGDSPREFTAVYLPAGSFLAVYSSAELNSWMKELHDGYPLSALSIPGTHNSPTCHTALPSVRCQAAAVREQLDNGVRFMDVRVSANADDDDLALVHSVFPVSLTGTKHLDGLLADAYAFLDANPSEALIVSLKREGTGKGTDQHLSRYLRDRYLAGDAARGRWFTEPRIPALGEARGKIVLVRRFGLDDALRGEHGGAGWGIDAASWPDNCADGTVGSGLIRVQDFYEVDQSTNIQKKIELARAQLERACQQLFALPGLGGAAAVPALPPGLQAAEQQQQLPFFVNFLSASNFFNASCWPEKIAAKVNPSVIEYLCIRHADPGKGPGEFSVGDAGTGIVVTDWVGHNGDWDLIRCIVGWNARLQMKQ